MSRLKALADIHRPVVHVRNVLVCLVSRTDLVLVQIRRLIVIDFNMRRVIPKLPCGVVYNSLSARPCLMRRPTYKALSGLIAKHFQADRRESSCSLFGLQ